MGKSLEDADWVPDVCPTFFHACGCCFCSSVAFTLIIMFFPCTVVQLGQYRIGLAKNTVNGRVDMEQVFHPGRYWIGFWREFIEFPSTLQTIEFSDAAPEAGVQDLEALRCRDRNGKKVELDIAIQYRLVPERLGDIYRDFRLLYEDLFISEIRDALNKAANRFAIAQMWEEPAYVRSVLFTKCQEVLIPRHAECWGLQLLGVRLSGPYEEALTRTQVRKQAKRTEVARQESEVVRGQTAVILAEYTKNITVITANGTAQVYTFEREAGARASAAMIAAYSDTLNISRTIVRMDASEHPNAVDLEMTNEQLVNYQKLLMLSQHTSSSLIYSTSSRLTRGNRRLQEDTSPAPYAKMDYGPQFTYSQ